MGLSASELLMRPGFDAVSRAIEEGDDDDDLSDTCNDILSWLVLSSDIPNMDSMSPSLNNKTSYYFGRIN
jgi:hypothetical protein